MGGDMLVQLGRTALAAAVFVLAVAAGAVIWPNTARSQSSPVSNWGGLWVGGNLGEWGGTSDFDRKSRGASFPGMSSWGGTDIGSWGGTDRFGRLPSPSFATNGQLVSVDVGYNWQAGPLVVGPQATFNWTNIKGDTDENCPRICSFDNSWLGLVGARVGYPVANALPFVSAGFADGNVGVSNGRGLGIDETRGGWYLGAGIEWPFTPNLSFTLGVNYVSLNSASCDRPDCRPSVSAWTTGTYVYTGLSWNFSSLGNSGYSQGRF